MPTRTDTFSADGTSTSFRLDAAPVHPTTVVVYRNGQRIREGVGNDYVLESRNVVFSIPPRVTSVITVDYEYR